MQRFSTFWNKSYARTIGINNACDLNISTFKSALNKNFAVRISQQSDSCLCAFIPPIPS